MSCERPEDGPKVDLDVVETLGDDGGDVLGDRGDVGDRGDRLCEARCDTVGDERGWSRQAAGRPQRPPGSPAHRVPRRVAVAAQVGLLERRAAALSLLTVRYRILSLSRHTRVEHRS